MTGNLDNWAQCKISYQVRHVMSALSLTPCYKYYGQRYLHSHTDTAGARFVSRNAQQIKLFEIAC